MLGGVLLVLVVRGVIILRQGQHQRPFNLLRVAQGLYLVGGRIQLHC